MVCFFIVAQMSQRGRGRGLAKQASDLTTTAMTLMANDIALYRNVNSQQCQSSDISRQTITRPHTQPILPLTLTRSRTSTPQPRPLLHTYSNISPRPSPTSSSSRQQQTILTGQRQLDILSTRTPRQIGGPQRAATIPPGSAGPSKTAAQRPGATAVAQGLPGRLGIATGRRTIEAATEEARAASNPSGRLSSEPPHEIGLESYDDKNVEHERATITPASLK